MLETKEEIVTIVQEFNTMEFYCRKLLGVCITQDTLQASHLKYKGLLLVLLNKWIL